MSDGDKKGNTGCLGRAFQMIGLFLLGVTIMGAFADIRTDGDFEFVGGIFPALAFLVAGSAMARRARREAENRPQTPVGLPGRAPRTRTGPAAPPPPTLPGPATTPPPASIVDPDSGLPDVPEPQEDLVLRALREVDETDFKPSKPLTSEERLQKAREKYLPKDPGTS